LACSPWPEITEAYEDEFGLVDPEVHKLAGTLWPLAETLALRAIQDGQAGQRLLVKAVAIVTRKFAEQPERMTNLKGYVFKTFYRLLSAESAKINRNSQLDDELERGEPTFARKSEADVDEIILVHELMRRADERTREIFHFLALGHSYEEIAKEYGVGANHLRSQWSKKLRKLKKQILAETRAAERRALLNLLRER
jgi:DNA-directed RNA polymerase specialized sigma24 family protein